MGQVGGQAGKTMAVAAARSGRRSCRSRCHRRLLTPIRSDGLGIQKRESVLTAWEFRKGRKVGTEGRKEARLWGVAAADRVRCEGSVREPAAAAKKTSRWRAGRRCLTRRGPRCCGRGEVAGDCVFTVELFHTATVDHTVAWPLPHRGNSI